MKTNDIKECQLPDVQEFLKLSRILIRQMKLLSKTKIPEKYSIITKSAAENVASAIDKYIGNGK